MSTHKALIVGAGSMARNWGRALHENPGVTIGGWIDIDPAIAARAVEELGAGGIYTGSDLQDALAAVCPDFVVDVTPPSVHHMVVTQSLRYGVPVLGEKPMAENMADARDMVATSEQTGKLYMVSQNRRYNPGIRAFRKLIADQTGPLAILNSDFYIGAHFGGFREQMPHPLLLDMAIHTFDAARFISNSDAVAVYCEEFNPPWSWFSANSSATAIFEMEGGLRYTYRGSWVSEGKHTSWEANWRAVGPKGTAVWDGSTAPQADIVTGEPEGLMSPTRPVTASLDDKMALGINGSLRDFLNALDTGDMPLGECHDNIKSLAMVFAAIESSERGERVKVVI